MAYNTSRTVSDDSDVGMKVFYTGSGSADIAVASNGDLTLRVDAATVSTIDVSNASYNTFGEVKDTIDALTGWKAVLVDVLRSQSSNDTLKTMTTAAVNSLGTELLRDSSIDGKLSVGITNQGLSQNDVGRYNFCNWFEAVCSTGCSITMYELEDDRPGATEKVLGVIRGTLGTKAFPTYTTTADVGAKNGRLLVQMAADATGISSCRLTVLGGSMTLSKKFNED